MSIAPLIGFAPNTPYITILFEPAPINIVHYKQDNIIKAIWEIEHPRNSKQAIDAKIRENAVGGMQIRPIMVLTVNQLVGYVKYTLTDRKDSLKSVEMFKVYQNYYNPNWDEQTAAYLWNGGSNYKNATKEQWNRMNKYWKLVSKQIK